MKLLSRSEEIVLLAIWQLQHNAYGISIRDKVMESTGQDWSIGAIYAPLHRLEKKGLVRTQEGERVGRTTSGGFGHCLGKSLAMAYVSTAAIDTASELEIKLMNDWFPASIRWGAQ